MRSNFKKSFSWSYEFLRRVNSNERKCAPGRFPVLLTHSQTDLEFYATSRNFTTTTTRTTRSSTTTGLRISEEVKEAADDAQPVVALESAIITHGMPFPHNIETALSLQSSIRKEGAIPATIGVINGCLKVGLTDSEIEQLGTPSATKSTIKVSRRDLPIALTKGVNGGTTVSGTIIGAVKANIPIFATGGIGGVHRGAEASFDVSADLRELGRSSVAVISAGVKSILDIGKTLEYLETEGVCVAVLKKSDSDSREGSMAAVYSPQDDCNEIEQIATMGKSKESGTVKFPSFFTANSPFAAPYSIVDEIEAAHLINSSMRFGHDSGILIAVPIPKAQEAEGQKIEDAVQVALAKAGQLAITGKDMTPFLLPEINRLTSGSSLAANKCLIENNVRVATQIAIFLSKLRRTGAKSHSSCRPRPTVDLFSRESQISSPHRLPTKGKVPSFSADLDSSPRKRPVVIGGTSMDLIMTVLEETLVVSSFQFCSPITTSDGWKFATCQ